MAQVYPEDRGTNYAIRDGRKAAALIDGWLDRTAGEPAELEKVLNVPVVAKIPLMKSGTRL